MSDRRQQNTDTWDAVKARPTKITWDAHKRNRFSHVLEKLLRDGAENREVFEFDGYRFMIGYARDLCEYFNSLELTDVVIRRPRSITRQRK